MTNLIGILGGMGPEATILLQRKLVEAVPALDDSDHIPLLIDMNPQVPSRIKHLIEGTGEDPGPTLALMAEKLQYSGAKALAMPCNTAHHYASYIEKSVDIPLLNMVDLAAEYASKNVVSGGQVGILASPAVKHTQLFEAAFEPYGLTAIWPERDDLMLGAIRAIKANGASDQACETLKTASRELKAEGAELQFIACSEFSIIADSAAEGAMVVDTIDILVQAIVSFSKTSIAV